MLKITNLAYQNPGGCGHLKITINDDGDVHDIEWAGHEDDLLQLAKDVREFIGLPNNQDEEALLILWLALMNKKRGFTKAQCKEFDIDPA